MLLRDEPFGWTQPRTKAEVLMSAGLKTRVIGVPNALVFAEGDDPTFCTFVP
jgi:hypothetical protein